MSKITQSPFPWTKFSIQGRKQVHLMLLYTQKKKFYRTLKKFKLLAVPNVEYKMKGYKWIKRQT